MTKAYPLLLTEAAAAASSRSAVIDSKANRLCLYEGARQVGTCFAVATGKQSLPTLPGKHKVQQKVYKPSWQNFRTGKVQHWPNTPLGDYWLGFARTANGWQGIHVLPQGIGRNVSHGCVRMRKADATTVWHFLNLNDTIYVCSGCLR